MTCGAGVHRVQYEIIGAFPQACRDVGCYNPGSRLDGSDRPSAHALNPAEAADVGIVPAYRGRDSVGQRVFLMLFANRDAIGLVQCIWDSQIYSRSHGPTIRPYTANRHDDHIHIQLDHGHALDARTSVAPYLSKLDASVVVQPDPIPEDPDVEYLLEDTRIPTELGLKAKRIAIGTIRGADQISDTRQVDRYRSYRFDGEGAGAPLHQDRKGNVQTLRVDPLDMTAALERGRR